MTIEANWWFLELPIMAKDSVSVLGEFFTTNSVASMADSIVRESVQNSLDAKNEEITDPVSIRFQVGAAKKRETEHLFGTLWPHLEAAVKNNDPDGGPDLEKLLTLRELDEFRYLTIEDFNTTGLRGDPRDPVSDHKDNNELYYFVRTEGKSTKTGENRGSWGIGKYTYVDASAVSTFFFLTGRDPAGGFTAGPLSMGVVATKTHVLDGTRYEGYGYLGAVGSYGSDPEVIYPFESEGNLASDCTEIFGVSRRSEPGVSLVVPYIDEELTGVEIFKSVVRNYCVAVALGKLSVVVVGEQGEEWSLNAGNLESVLEELLTKGDSEAKELLPLVQLVKWGINPGCERVVLGKLPENEAPSWLLNYEMLMGEERSEAIRGCIDGNEMLAVRVPVHIEKKRNSEKIWSHIDVLFFSSDHGTSQLPHYYRDGLRISEVSPSPKTVRSVVLINDAPVTEMLGDAEGVAHINWSANTERFRGKYANGQNWISFIKNAPKEIIRLAQSGDRDEDETALQDAFNIPKPPTPKPKQQRKCKAHGNPLPCSECKNEDEVCKPHGNPKPCPECIKANEKEWRVTELDEGGFTIVSNKKMEKGVVVRVAYDDSSGDPLKNWKVYDFSYEDLPAVVVTEGGLIEKSGNSLTLQPDGNGNLKMSSAGFDPKRDLFVKVEKIV